MPDNILRESPIRRSIECRGNRVRKALEASRMDHRAEMKKLTIDQLHRGIARDIKRAGRFVMCVGGDENSPPFAYTIGNTIAGLPELLMIGDVGVAYLLHDLSQKMLERDTAFDEGELVSLGGKFPVKIINASTIGAWDDFTSQATKHFGHDDYAVQQVLIPDRSGRFPGDPGCAPPYSDFLVLARPASLQ
jgi:hypothetical protein